MMKVRIEGLLVAAALSAAAAPPTTLPKKKRVLYSLDEVGLIFMVDGNDGDGEADDDDH